MLNAAFERSTNKRVKQMIQFIKLVRTSSIEGFYLGAEFGKMLLKIYLKNDMVTGSGLGKPFG